MLKTSMSCPGSQNDVSVYGNLLFVSVESTTPAASTARRTRTKTLFRGIRIFDISNIEAPVQVAGVQTCRGSHTHTLVRPKNDPNNVYIYDSARRPCARATELAGCDANNTEHADGREPVAVADRRHQGPARRAADRRDRQRPAPVRRRRRARRRPAERPRRSIRARRPPVVGGNNPAGRQLVPSPVTDACHDITVYEALDLAAGACEGNGILIDISDPANPKRIDAVADPLFSYWHGATFSNDGKAVVFTDEWGGGYGARCRATDQLSWGANAIYEIVNRKLVFRSYYKLPVAQTTSENCVAHVGNLIPVQSRNVLVQAWYQGGVSVMDFTDLRTRRRSRTSTAVRSAAARLVSGGFWSTYWYNGRIYGSEIARGLDSFALAPTRQPVGGRDRRGRARPHRPHQRAEPGPDGLDVGAGPGARSAATCRRRCR